MASINKLSIRGIRSFSPDDDEQVVEFSFPCTMIVGANGCGKTTIIESLKYAVSGSLPPGNRAGQAFVHDPRSIGQSVVKGNVKLRITNRAGAPMVVIRSMEVTQKKTTMTFKQLDGVLRTMDPTTGERVSLSHKCTELDRQIPSLLGVSKAVLESVLFCHQEDASWPLMEGAVLKKRFDDIFDSTRYSKALESFRKTKKDLQLTVKDLKADLNGLASHKHAVKGFRNDRETQHNMLNQLEDEMADYTKQIQDYQRNLEEIRSIVCDIEQIRNEMEKVENDWTTKQQLAEQQRSMLGKRNDFTKKHTSEQLNKMLQDFDDQLQDLVAEKQQLQTDTSSLQEELGTLRTQQITFHRKMGKFLAEKEAQETRMKDRLVKMESIAQTYNIDLQTLSLSQNTSSFVQLDDQTSSSLPFNTTNASMTSMVVDDEKNNNNNNTNTQETIMSISPEDMHSFLRNLQRAEDKLRDDLKNHRDRVRNEEDQLQSTLTDLTAKQKAIENECAKLSTEHFESQREIQSLPQGAAAYSIQQLQKDIESYKERAKVLAKQLDGLTNDPRRKNIPIEIRSLDEKIDKCKRQIEDDQLALTQLRTNVEAQNAVVVLQEQCAKDLECLQESLTEQSYTLRQKFNIRVPVVSVDSATDDSSADKLAEEVEDVKNALQEKYDTAKLNLDKKQDEISKSQQWVSEHSGMLSHRKQAVAQLQAKMRQLEEDSVDKVRRVVQEIKTHEAATADKNKFKLSVDEKDPQGLLQYLDKKLEEIEEDFLEGAEVPKSAVKTVIKKLMKLTKVKEGGKTKRVMCPCCRRGLGGEAAQIFKDSMEELSDIEKSPLLRVDTAALEKHRILKPKYEKWKNIVSSCMNDVLNYHRMVLELKNELEPKVEELQQQVSSRQLELSEAKMEMEDVEEEVKEFTQLINLSKRWSDETERISSKQFQISQKQKTLTASLCGVGGSDRDLKTVERELNQHVEEKENYTNSISRLNKDMAHLNTQISQVAEQASNMDKLVRDNEEKLLKEKKAMERKKTLSSRMNAITEETNKLQQQLAPLRQKIKAKKSEKERLRAHAGEEEEKKNETLNLFLADVKNLKDITKQIDEYANSNQLEEYNSSSADSAKITESMKEKEKNLESLQAKLEKVTKTLDDQENHKKILKENMYLLQLEDEMKHCQKEIQQLQEEENNIVGHDTCKEDFEKFTKKKSRLEAMKARSEGRRSEMIDQIRAINRKLSTPEYENIDERHRVAMIKHETTQLAVEDLDKYATALDKALLKFHSLKIGDINKIIKELWLLTYKGEDITNIEIVSGQEAGSRATKSYNYRVVMTKGDTKLDMRGRCSAGQRVLASIVIRLALAETFGVNCGCIALDEPTVNLDDYNKRGLATALAQIIASRAQQRNFQLILITHDEQFVSLMKTELATQSGFPMPEKYFQVRREEGSDGKFYSKIDAVDWDELL